MLVAGFERIVKEATDQRFPVVSVDSNRGRGHDRPTPRRPADLHRPRPRQREHHRPRHRR